ncbi:hypothetical protein GLAREA_10391 [Glarea lozoyensis ATCC 20868]|uniref:Vegetative incompatibility protein HET-E-1 n=1 Tax=Glarea lozoyensis (strain ATCC 20868 / MF5171) TaxID=1116229 RepID=S3D870_GLAL2|nr:uncharacterized protein GLAREA_10391 [Glarea lozoyensis ATCC 20868]EPE34697.1 hypothetical protein GLAREA_10391 [Glarea lozoyensis ATCC 20868]
MRLIEFNDGGDFSLTHDFIDDVPRYAILSHTWGKDTEEVTYRDLMGGTGKDKVGYDKIRFCGEQAARDNLQYFWVDTCCIDKSDAIELQTAINCMFRWYKNAAKCYVYLSDVSTTEQKESDRLLEHTWESAFRSSRWFTRGWTLQELLAPSSVEFFSADCELLGDKKSLEPLIHEVTGLPVKILQGYDLARFSFDERVSWTMKRQTKHEEDMIYSLLGIFGVSLILNYGEGRDNALRRLRDEADIHQRFILGRLQFVDNAAFDSHEEEHNARCYQGTRVELLRQIDTWAEHSKNECIFWLSGMAGTGKSTISRTVAQNFANKRELGASFFFKRGEGDRGHAGILITTIVTQLVQKLPSLALPVRNAIEADPSISRKALKQQFNMLISEPLRKIQTDRQEPSTIVIVVDALDECDREEDIRIIIHTLSQAMPIPSIRLRFFITSRPELPIRLGFEDINGRYDRLALQQIPKPIIKEDISVFLEYELAMIRDKYNKSVPTHRKLPIDWPGQTDIQSLVRMAVPLFIFASTICRFINDRKIGQPKGQLAKVLEYETKSQASKLDATYLPVLNQLIVGANDSERRDIVEGFTQVVGSIVILANPLSATSLDLLLGVPEDTVESKTDLLHSVLSVPSNPHHPIRLLHLSFRDFLVDPEKRKTNLFWINEKDRHAKLADRCLQVLSMNENLKKDICNLQAPEKTRADVDKRTIDLHLPPEVQYACQYWVYHLKESGGILYDDNQVHNFLKSHFLHWLEALSFIGRLRESISMIENLVAMIQVGYSSLSIAKAY